MSAESEAIRELKREVGGALGAIGGFLIALTIAMLYGALHVRDAIDRQTAMVEARK